mgnify:CR=1 FL=1
MFKKNNLEFQGGLLPLNDMLVSDTSVPNVQETKQETYYPSINDPNFYNSIYQEKPVDNLNDYYKSYTISKNQANNTEKVETFDQSKRITMLQTTKNNEINKQINQKENITIKNNVIETTQKSQSQPVIQVEKNINTNPENIVLRSAPKSLKKNKIEKKNDVLNDDNNKDNNINKNNNNLLNEKKYFLKYLMLKKETKLKSLLKMNFGKYNKNVIKQKDIKTKTENKQNVINNENKENNENNKELKIKKLRDIVRKKISKNREKMHILFIKYYYSSLYIHLKWYMYVVNQLTYQQSMNPAYQTTYSAPITVNPQDTSNTNDNNETEDPDPFKDIPSAEDTNIRNTSEVDDAFRQSVMNIRKMNNSNNMEQAFRESMMTINRLNDALNNEEEKKKKLEKKKHLKDLVSKRLKEVKNDFHKMFTKFYYQGLLVEKTKKQNEESNEGNELTEGAPTKLRAKKNPVLERRNKARNLRKLMAKKEKEKIDTLRKYFSKFYTNGLLCKLKRNAKYSQSTKNVRFNMDVEFYNEEENKKEQKEEELTLLDKKRIEEKKKKEELDLKRISALKIIFFKKDRNITIIKKKTIEKWNLRAKLMSLESLKKGKKRDLAKSTRIKKKKLKSSKNVLDFKKGAKSQVIKDSVAIDEENQNNKK